MYSIPAVSSTTTFPTSIPGIGASPAGEWLETGEVFTNVASFYGVIAPSSVTAGSSVTVVAYTNDLTVTQVTFHWGFSPPLIVTVTSTTPCPASAPAGSMCYSSTETVTAADIGTFHVNPIVFQSPNVIHGVHTVGTPQHAVFTVT